MPCPYLEYRDAAPAGAPDATTPPGGSFDEPRAFCTVLSEFVQPMRADVCNDRYDLHHAAHCEIFRAHHAPADDDAADRTDGDDPESR